MFPFCLLSISFLFCPVHETIADVTALPSLSTGVSYTDNVYLTPENEEYDWLTFISPGIDISMTGKRSGLDIGLYTAYVSYTRFPDQNTWRYGVNLNGWADITKETQLFFDSSFLRTEDPLGGPSTPGSPPDTTVRRGRNPYYTSTTTIGVLNRFGAQDEISLQYTSNLLENEDASIEDSAYHRPQILMTYWLLPNRYALEMGGDLYKGVFEESEDYDDWNAQIRFIKNFNRQLNGYIGYNHTIHNYLDSGEDYTLYNPEVGFSWIEQSNTQFSAILGYWYRNNKSSENDDGPSALVNMSYTYATDSSFAFEGGAGYDRADFGSENLGFNPYYTVNGTVSHLLAPRTTGMLTAGYRRNFYIDEEPDREDAVWFAGAGLGYQVLPWLTFNFDYRYSQINSNINYNDYVENRGTISFTLAPLQPSRL